ncbi:FIG00554181: hypothetical protein [Cronobacter turicensis 564]|nr:FIG00554181: hypothetical protein [Cronobacter turicensis 564]
MDSTGVGEGCAETLAACGAVLFTGALLGAVVQALKDIIIAAI